MSDPDDECKGDDCLGCATADCGIDLTQADLRAKRIRCRGCAAEAEGRPYGGCLDCGGAYDLARTCACGPHPKVRRR